MVGAGLAVSGGITSCTGIARAVLQSEEGSICDSEPHRPESCCPNVLAPVPEALIGAGASSLGVGFLGLSGAVSPTLVPILAGAGVSTMALGGVVHLCSDEQ